MACFLTGHCGKVFRDKFTDEQLFNIRCDAISGRWPELLGPKPLGFDDLPDNRPEGWRARKYEKVKADFLQPIANLTYALLGAEKINYLAYEKMSTKNKLVRDFSEVSFGVKTSIIEELSEHIAKSLDW